MTTPKLTPEDRRRAERFVSRATLAARVSFVLVFGLLLAAIWGGGWRCAATAVLLAPIGAAAAALATRVRRALARAEET
jgi:fatty acid desaturase